MTKRKLTKVSLCKRPPSRLSPGVVQWSIHNELDQYRGVLQLEVLSHGGVRVTVHTLGLMDTGVVFPDGIKKAVDSILKSRGYYIDWKEAPDAILP